MEEIPEFNRFYEQNKNNNLAMFAVNYDALPAIEQKMLVQQFNIRYPSLRQDPAATLQLGNINAVPATFIFTPEGKLSHTLYGRQTSHSLTRAITQAYRSNVH